MSLFDMCCPKKPKRSLDYIIKWVEETDKTLKDLTKWKNTIDSDIESLVQEAVENYDWSDLPQEALETKADKVINATAGNLAQLDAEGNLVDSRKKVSDFASADHTHTHIGNATTSVSVDTGGDSMDLNASSISFNLHTENPAEFEHIEFTSDNASNLKRALANPDITPVSGSDNFVTSGTVYEALQNKSSVGHSHDTIFSGNTSISIDGNDGIISIEASNSDRGGETAITPYNIENLDRALQDPDTTPISESDKLVTSGGVYAAVSKKVDLYRIACKSNSTRQAIYFNNNTEVDGYDNFVSFISDYSDRVITILLNGGRFFNCIATLDVGEEYTDDVSGLSSWDCILTIGSNNYTCTVLDDPQGTSSFNKQV